MTARPESRRPAGVRTMDGLAVAGKRVLVRADLNVPTKAGQVTDRERIERLAPTLRELMEKGAVVIVLSHFGRPKGKPSPEFSLRIVAPALAAALGRSEIRFAEDCIGPQAEAAAVAARPGEVVLLENLRFHPGEEANDEGFARALAKLGDAVVNDAFSAAHRAHASVDTLCRLLPSAAGRLMEAEIRALGAALESPKRPVAALIGGAKVSTKLEVLGHLVGKVDRLVIGGAMANTFLAAQGVAVGTSLREAEMADRAKAILKAAADAGCQVLLPVDAVVAGALKEGVPTETVAIDRVPADRMILDVGPQSVARIVAALRECRTLVWNGPLGAFEIEPFHVGTVTVASAAAELTRAGRLMSVAGGGDTVAALAKAAVLGDFSYVSTAGGAFLEWLEGRDLPGVRVLRG